MAADPECRALRLESVAVDPLPSTASRRRWSLRVRVSNGGSRVASQLRFQVRVGGEELLAYRRRAFLRRVPAGGVAEISLFSFSSPEAGGDEHPPVEVRLTQAVWFEVHEEEGGTETWTPAGTVPSLPPPVTLTALESHPGPADERSGRRHSKAVRCID